MDFSIGAPGHSVLPLTTYPNPSSGFISLINFNYEIIDQRGRQVLTGQAKSNHLDLKGLGSGLYFLRIDDGEQNRITKIIIE